MKLVWKNDLDNLNASIKRIFFGRVDFGLSTSLQFCKISFLLYWKKPLKKLQKIKTIAEVLALQVYFTKKKGELWLRKRAVNNSFSPSPGVGWEAIFELCNCVFPVAVILWALLKLLGIYYVLRIFGLLEVFISRFLVYITKIKPDLILFHCIIVMSNTWVISIYLNHHQILSTFI